MSQIQQDMKELHAVASRLKALNLEAKNLRDRKKQLETTILQYLDETENPGLKYHELTVLRKEGTTRKKLKKQEKQDNVIKVLEDNGVSNPEKIYETITQVSIGQKETKQKLKVEIALPEIDSI